MLIDDWISSERTRWIKIIANLGEVRELVSKLSFLAGAQSPRSF